MAMKIKVNEAAHRVSLRGAKPTHPDVYKSYLRIIKERASMLARLKDM